MKYENSKSKLSNTCKLTASDGVNQSKVGLFNQYVGHPFILFVVGLICLLGGREGRKQRELSLQK